jgi:hypothetical protein
MYDPPRSLLPPPTHRVTDTGLEPEDEKSRLYVGLNRARVYLVVVATAATLERLQLADLGR